VRLGLEPVEATTLVEAAAYRIQKAILDGELAPGTELRQEELCASLGISRTPVREALRRVESQGLVVLRANRTAIVRHMARAEIVDLYAIRAHLEALACERACNQITQTDLAAIQEAQTDLEAASESLLGSRAELDEATQLALHEALRDANDRFHGAIHTASGSPTLTDLIVGLWNRFPKDHAWRVLAGEKDAVIALNVTQHRSIIAALLDRDPPLAAARMSEHVLHSGQLLTEYLEAREFWSTTETVHNKSAEAAIPRRPGHGR
jgi:DNA-binding GntR family transcriptional regulator